MKTFSDFLRFIAASIVTLLVVIAIWACSVFGVMLLIKSIIPFTGVLAVVLMLVGVGLVQELLLGKIVDQLCEIVANVIFYLFGTNYEMWDAWKVKTVSPIKQDPPEPAAA